VLLTWTANNRNVIRKRQLKSQAIKLPPSNQIRALCFKLQKKFVHVPTIGMITYIVDECFHPIVSKLFVY
jgi:hypothetical protein